MSTEHLAMLCAEIRGRPARLEQGGLPKSAMRARELHELAGWEALDKGPRGAGRERVELEVDG